MMILADPEAVLGLLSLPGVGPASVMRLYEWADSRGLRFGEALADPDGRCFALRGKAEISPEVLRNQVGPVLSALESHGVQLVGFHDPRYPDQLKSRLGRSSPPLLTVLGNVDLLNNHRAVGFCGSRKASDKGLAVAVDCAGQLARAGMNVVSGYATGVDMATHSAALKEGGTTTIVLAEGILKFRLKPEIASAWDWSRVAVVSEFDPNQQWQVHSAMQRNKTICGLSSSMVLIEARSTGGSIEAGRAALNLGIPLFAAVYEGMPEWANGNQELLRHGARSLLKSRTNGHANVRPLLDWTAGPNH